MNLVNAENITVLIHNSRNTKDFDENTIFHNLQ